MSALTFELRPQPFCFYHLSDTTAPRAQALVADDAFFVNMPGDRSLMAVEGTIDLPFQAKEAGWRCLKLTQAFQFSEVGIAARVTHSLAESEVSVLVMSGFAHDYFFVREMDLEAAVAALTASGYEFLA